MNVFRMIVVSTVLLMAMLVSLSAVGAAGAQPAGDAENGRVTIARTVTPFDGLLCLDNQHQLYLSSDGQCDWQLLPVHFSTEKPIQTCIGSSSWEYSPTGICGGNHLRVTLPSTALPVKACASGSHNRLRHVTAIDLCTNNESPISQRPLVLITDSQNNRVQKFFSDGSFVDSWGRLGQNTGEFSFPAGIAVDQNGNSVVADWANNRIQVFDPAGVAIESRDFASARGEQPPSPTGVAFDQRSNLTYIADGENHRILVYSQDGQFIASWGSKGSSAGRFDNPWGVAIDRSGFVYVADTGNKRIQVFDGQGVFIRQWGVQRNR